MTATSNPVDISILVPVMNEAGNVRPLIDEICSVFAGRRFEIIYIDDASNDATADELAAALIVVPQLRVLRHAHRAGQSAAIWSGLLQASGDLIGVLDGDGQNVPADFPALEAAMIAASKDGRMVMAAGIRQLRDDSPMRLVASRAAKRVRASLLADTHPDSGCGIKLLPRALFCNCPFSIICTALCQALSAEMAALFWVCRWRIGRGSQEPQNTRSWIDCLLASLTCLG